MRKSPILITGREHLTHGLAKKMSMPGMFIVITSLVSIIRMVIIVHVKINDKSYFNVVDTSTGKECGSWGQ